MSKTTKTTPRAIVTDVLGPGMTREIWTANYDKALPISVQDFDLSAVLPAVFYMFRFGHRRGKGEFLKTFAEQSGSERQRKRSATIERVATTLAADESFAGFEDETSNAILGDLLLAFCLENRNRALGRDEQVQRVAPAHYMAGWVDLPDHVAHLRFVPEMLVAMLADQKGEYIEQNRVGDRTWFAVGRGFEDNVLLKAFHQGMEMEQKDYLSNRAADRFREEELVGLDQLLMIRLAQQLKNAPDKLRGGEGERISNQHPIAERATRHFSEDIRQFVLAYADAIPRHAFVELLESCMAVGLTTILTSVIELLFNWTEAGEISHRSEQQPAPLFVDCSTSVDRRLQTLAEQSMDDLMRRVERFPVILAALRLLDYSASTDRRLKNMQIEERPYATEWLNLLGELLHERREEAQLIHYSLEQKSVELSERLKEEEYEEAADILTNDRVEPNPVWRLAEALTFLQGRRNVQKNFISMIDSALLVTRPNGLAMKRTVTRREDPRATAKRRELRSLVFTDAVLDYLVHRHLLRGNSKQGHRPLSLSDFLGILQERYGFYVDEAPPGMTISNELLQLNRLVLERRLRDLGLLVGVNDAESMKQLRARFKERKEGNDELE